MVSSLTEYFYDNHNDNMAWKKMTLLALSHWPPGDSLNKGQVSQDFDVFAMLITVELKSKSCLWLKTHDAHLASL